MLMALLLMFLSYRQATGDDLIGGGERYSRSLLSSE